MNTILFEFENKTTVEYLYLGNRLGEKRGKPYYRVHIVRWNDLETAPTLVVDHSPNKRNAKRLVEKYLPNNCPVS